MQTGQMEAAGFSQNAGIGAGAAQQAGDSSRLLTVAAFIVAMRTRAHALRQQQEVLRKKFQESNSLAAIEGDALGRLKDPELMRLWRDVGAAREDVRKAYQELHRDQGLLQLLTGGWIARLKARKDASQADQRLAAARQRFEAYRDELKLRPAFSRALNLARQQRGSSTSELSIRIGRLRTDAEELEILAAKMQAALREPYCCPEGHRTLSDHTSRATAAMSIEAMKEAANHLVERFAKARAEYQAMQKLEEEKRQAAEQARQAEKQRKKGGAAPAKKQPAVAAAPKQPDPPPPPRSDKDPNDWGDDDWGAPGNTAAPADVKAPAQSRMSSSQSRQLYPQGLFSPRKIPADHHRNPKLGRPGPLPPGPHDAKIYLPIGRDKHQAALHLGAMSEQDAEGISIYVHVNQDLSPFQDMLPLAHRTVMTPIEVDMIPETSWGASLANLMTRPAWNKVRQPHLMKFGHRCEICGERGGELGAALGQNTGLVDCHEVWEYHQVGSRGYGVQKLSRLMSLCRDCHMCFHIGLANIHGVAAQVLGRLLVINRWNEAELKAYMTGMTDAYSERSRVKWALDLSLFAPGGGDYLQLKGDPKAAETVILGTRYRCGNEGDIMGPVPATDWY